ncbi:MULTISPECIES: DUF998 domain-containing protein [Shewanella]|jgi:hypothetical membrane protein|uniref:DUF998 domain-containing protein n=1 Tax=Shewanella TaxID=22 RepID=UPI000B3479B8|nr:MULTISPECIES: DUF998 domain-containing protein [Shewanella]QXN24047.1 DUF998 domain-containing protein [Shewanella putrefaciens]MCD8551534.1 DUF998 domain-containing protein [Shewanella xiamenensis]MCD8557625.1 DUF998 domain-containing protein [Shewanella xiamenensis]MDH1469411.1 DUF998 domain-containing protein [Shewanella sp. GD03713]MDL3986404.1 DUF998 domain-containing protein [Shewanella xiamenensis]
MTVIKMNMATRGSALATKFGFLGIFGLMLGICVAVFGFDYSETRSFNFLNHTLSELGTYGHSSFAVVLNGGLFFGSLSVVFYCLSSLQTVSGFWGYPFFCALALTFLALACVGLFPVNVYHLHILALKWFFYFGSLSAICYLLWVGFGSQHRQRLTILLALLVLLSMMTFLYVPLLALGLTEGDRPFYQEMILQLPRPDLWWPALLEWIGLGSLLSWTVALLLTPPSCIPTFTQEPTLE